jgi:hypothetical protein
MKNIIQNPWFAVAMLFVVLILVYWAVSLMAKISEKVDEIANTQNRMIAPETVPQQ